MMSNLGIETRVLELRTTFERMLEINNIRVLPENFANVFNPYEEWSDEETQETDRTEKKLSCSALMLDMDEDDDDDETRTASAFSFTQYQTASARSNSLESQLASAEGISKASGRRFLSEDGRSDSFTPVDLRTLQSFDRRFLEPETIQFVMQHDKKAFAILYRRLVSTRDPSALQVIQKFLNSQGTQIFGDEDLLALFRTHYLCLNPKKRQDRFLLVFQQAISNFVQERETSQIDDRQKRVLVDRILFLMELCVDLKSPHADISKTPEEIAHCMKGLNEIIHHTVNTCVSGSDEISLSYIELSCTLMRVTIEGWARSGSMFGTQAHFYDDGNLVTPLLGCIRNGVNLVTRCFQEQLFMNDDVMRCHQAVIRQAVGRMMPEDERADILGNFVELLTPISQSEDGQKALANYIKSIKSRKFADVIFQSWRRGGIHVDLIVAVGLVAACSLTELRVIVQEKDAMWRKAVGFWLERSPEVDRSRWIRLQLQADDTDVAMTVG